MSEHVGRPAGPEAGRCKSNGAQTNACQRPVPKLPGRRRGAGEHFHVRGSARAVPTSPGEGALVLDDPKLGPPKVPLGFRLTDDADQRLGATEKRNGNVPEGKLREFSGAREAPESDPDQKRS